MLHKNGREWAFQHFAATFVQEFWQLLLLSLISFPFPPLSLQETLQLIFLSLLVVYWIKTYRFTRYFANSNFGVTTWKNNFYKILYQFFQVLCFSIVLFPVIVSWIEGYYWAACSLCRLGRSTFSQKSFPEFFRLCFFIVMLLFPREQNVCLQSHVWTNYCNLCIDNRSASILWTQSSLISLRLRDEKLFLVEFRNALSLKFTLCDFLMDNLSKSNEINPTINSVKVTPIVMQLNTKVWHLQ